MVMEAEPILRAVDKARGRKKSVKIILLTPHGKKFDNKKAENLIKYKDIILISGRYEGIDERVKKILKPEEISIGDYILTGGELPAMVIMDAVARRTPGVLGKNESVEEKRVAGKEIYTRPAEFKHKGKNYKVPKVLLSGHHKKIEGFRKKK
jgi:tRNA (guanine37-N1)-methyltransferase